MSKQSYETVTKELLSTIQDSLDNKRIAPALLLLYSGIDTMAWLSREESHLDVLLNDFENWVENYLLPDAGLACNAIDLYGARCSIIHSYTAESRLSRLGQARRIFYAVGNKNAEELQEYIDAANYPDTTALHVGDLFNAFRMGIERFNHTLANNPVLANLVHQRADKFLVYFAV